MRKTCAPVFLFLCLVLLLSSLLGNVAFIAAVDSGNYLTWDQENNTQLTVQLQDIDSGLTSPSGNYRWLDIADQAYSGNYSASYNYSQATVRLVTTTLRLLFRSLMK